MAAAIVGHGIIGFFTVGVGFVTLLPIWEVGIVCIGLAGVLAVVHRRGLAALRRARRPQQAPVLRIASWNVQNTNTGAFVAEGVQATGADVVVLFETEQRHIEALQTLGSGAVRFARCGDGRDEHDGLAVYTSRENVRTESREIGGMCAVRCEIDLDGWRVAVWGYRPTAPTSVARVRSWELQMQALEEVLAGEPLPYLLVGDLNSCVWHVPLQRVVRRGRLRRASQLFGGTWRHPRLGWRARIDHLYVSPGIGAEGARRLSPYGSDHRPLVVDIGPEKCTAAPTRRTAGTLAR